MMKDYKKYLAESVGTFVLVLFGCGTAILSGGNLLVIAITFGLIIVAMAYSIGNISGCHINPAVSFAMALSKKLSWKDFGFYTLFQIAGGLLGSLVLMLILGDNANLAANTINSQVITAGGFQAQLIGVIIEVILTFVFIIAIIGVTDKTENKAVVGIVIGLSLALVHIFGVNLTGSSVNPARSIAPALLQGGIALEQLWIYIVGPLLGAALAAFMYRFLSKNE